MSFPTPSYRFHRSWWTVHGLRKPKVSYTRKSDVYYLLCLVRSLVFDVNIYTRGAIYSGITVPSLTPPLTHRYLLASSIRPCLSRRWDTCYNRSSYGTRTQIPLFSQTTLRTFAHHRPTTRNFVYLYIFRTDRLDKDYYLPNTHGHSRFQQNYKGSL